MRSTLQWVVLLALCCCTTLQLNAQDRCGTMQSHTDPAAIAAAQARLAQIASTTSSSLAQPLVTIDVIFHVMNGSFASEAAAREAICAQLDQINEDFQATNDDLHATQFAGLVGNAMVQFQMANKDPYGNDTDGIIFWDFGAATYGMADFENTIKACSQWDPTKYLNFWIGNLTGGLLGYAQFPPSYFGDALVPTDGVVCAAFSIGSTDCDAGGRFGLGRTATHEIGHWLGLFHIWGDDGGACGGAGDNIGDTPDQGGDTAGCPDMTGTTVISSCGSPDMYMNYMDYTDDACMNMFTAGQATVVQGIMATDRASMVVTSRPCPPAISLTVINESCVDADDGTIVVKTNLANGCQEFALDTITSGQVNPFQTSPIFGGLACGSYTITVRDPKEEGCTASLGAMVEVEVEEPPMPATATATCAPPTLTVACPACTNICPFNPNEMTLTVNIQGTHAFPGDLGYYLTSPAGTLIPLAPFQSRCYDGGANFDLTFVNGGAGYFNTVDLAAGSIAGTFGQAYGLPVNFCQIAGENIYGNWTIGVQDCWTADTGIITSFSVSITGGCATGATGTDTPNTAIPDGTDNATTIGDGSCGGFATAVATFVAPTAPTVTIEWSNAAGDSVGVGTNFTPSDIIMPGDMDVKTYYAQCLCDTCFSKPTPVSYSCNCPVPVELLNFEATAVDQTVVLDWATASELDNSHFEVERSLDGEKFVQLGKVTGAGTTVTSQAYSFVDVAPKQGANYYRLKQVDLDGTFEYTNVVTLQFGIEKVATEVFPSPTSDVLNVKAGLGADLIRVFDITGKEVMIVQGQKATLTQLNVSKLRAGTYFVRIQLTDGTAETLRFVKN